MPTISQDVVTRLTNLQNQVWQTVSMTVSEVVGSEIKFSDPLTVSTPTSDVYAETTSPKLVIQFSFANQPENAMIVLMPQESLAGFAEAVKGESIANVDDSIVSDIRPAVEAIVQGICLAVGNSRNEPTVASGLSIRYQILSFPPNFQKVDELIRVNVTVVAEEFRGTLTWLMDSDVGHLITGVEPIDEDSHEFRSFSGTAFSRGDLTTIDDQGLEIIMDIPLEVSVELGRVKMQIKEVVELGAGSIVEIDKAAGEPVDVLVNGRLVARGEVVVIDDNFGVRITEILSLQERLQRLNEAA